MTSYKKVFIKGGAEVKEFDRGNVMKVSVNFDDLVERVRNREIKITESGNIYFDIVEKKAEKQKQGESTHYLVQSQKMTEDEEQEQARRNSAEPDLPF